MRSLHTLPAFAFALALSAADMWQSTFAVEKKNLGPSGANRYLPLEPGLRLHYVEGSTRIVITVLPQTHTVDGVETRVVEEFETSGGSPAEKTRDYFAADAKTGDVYYFGEDVDVYKAGKVVHHEGSWLSGVKGARFGLMMPGAPKVGQRFHEEYAPGTAMDRAEIVSVSETITTPAGTFVNCVRVRETNPLEKGAAEEKWYAPGVGLVKDGSAVLEKIERIR